MTPSSTTESSQPELPFKPDLDPEAMRAAAGDAARLMRTIGNESRLTILCQLSQGECSVGDLQASLPLTQPALSQHLARLRKEGLVETRRESRHIFYRLAPGPIEGVLEALYSVYCGGRSA